MKKILFVIPSLAEGGAEKVITMLLNHLNRQKFFLSLVLFERKGGFLGKVPPDVNIFDLKKKSRFSFLNLVFGLSKIVKEQKPSVVVSFLEYANLVTLLAKKTTSNSQTCWVTSERSLPSLSYSHMRLSNVRLLLHKLLDKTADLIIVNSPETREEMTAMFSVPPEKIRLTPNPVETQKIKKLSTNLPIHQWYKDKIPILVAVGRLSEPKGYAYLLRAFSEVLEEIDCRLIILGEGELHKKLEALIEKLEITESVNILGFLANPYPYVAYADIFVLPSLWEGLPNSLLEAMVLGKPVIATRCSKAVENIVENGRNGILVPPGNVESLRNAMLRFLQNRSLWSKFGEEGQKRASTFDIRQIIAKYEEVFNESFAN